MTDNKQFEQKWNTAYKNGSGEESDIFVEKGEKPVTQRQFNLFHLYEYIGGVAEAHNLKSALELGCGRGTVSLYLSKYLGIDVTATDLAPDAVLLAKKNFETHKAKATIVEADAMKLSFPDNSFDLSVSIGLAEHIPDYPTIFREQYRVLRPGGCMISYNVPKKSSIQVLNSIYRFFLKHVTQKKLNPDYYRNEDAPEQYKAQAIVSGFKRTHFIYVNSFPLFTPVSPGNEKRITAFYRLVYKVRGWFMEYPFKGSKLLSQAHFLVGWKE